MKPLRLRLVADHDAPRTVRHQLKSWLHAAPLAAQDRDDLLLAVDEAVTNVVDHAYTQSDAPGDVVVAVDVGQYRGGSDCIVATVSDRGQWRPPPSDPGYRGRGLALMKCCTAWLRIEPSNVGTHVIMGTAPI